MVDDVLLAVLAMDAYNRGEVDVLTQSSNRIGNATLLQSIDILSIGFSASAYEVNLSDSGDPELQRIVSYRGTDGLPDIPYGWPTDIGAAWSPQNIEALNFYNGVAADAILPVILTGHSLGGGLAGYVAALHGLKATLVANMAFELAASSARELALDENRVEGQQLRDLIYGDGPVTDIDRSQIHTIYVDGEVLVPLRALQSTPANALPFISPYLYPYGAVSLHSSALHAILAYADSIQLGFGSWSAAASVMLDAFFSDDVASAIGFGNLDGGGSPVAKMGHAIAYSVLTGSQDALPWGDTAAASFLNDAQDLAVGQGSFSISPAYQSAPTRLANIAVEYSGLLARERMTTGDKPVAPTGVLRTTENQASITADFRDETWTFGDQLIESNYKMTLFDRAVEASTVSISSVDMAFYYLGMQGLIDESGGYSQMKGMTFQIAPGEQLASAFPADGSGDIAVQFLGPYYQNVVVVDGGGINMTIGSFESDIINGSSGVDTIFGGDENDILSGKEGNDFLSGGDGDDQLFGGSASNYIMGESGNDTLVSEGSYDELYGGEGDDTIVIQGDAEFAQIRGGEGDDTINASRAIYLPYSDYPHNVVHFDYGDGHDSIIQGHMGAMGYFPDGSDYLIRTWGVQVIDMGSIPMSDITLYYQPAIIWEDPPSEVGSNHILLGDLTIVVDSTGESIWLDDVFSHVVDGASEGDLTRLLDSTWYMNMPQLQFGEQRLAYAGAEGLKLIIGQAPGSSALQSLSGSGVQMDLISADLLGGRAFRMTDIQELSWFSVA